MNWFYHCVAHLNNAKDFNTNKKSIFPIKHLYFLMKLLKKDVVAFARGFPKHLNAVTIKLTLYGYFCSLCSQCILGRQNLSLELFLMLNLC